MMVAALLHAITDHWVTAALFGLSFCIWYVLVDRVFCFGWLLSREKSAGKRRIVQRIEADLARNTISGGAPVSICCVRTWERELEKGFAVIKIATAAAPLLGLLGTVWGMLMTFEAIAQSGTGQPALMADGISYALTTTMWGLIVAVPGMVAIPLLVRCKQRIMAEVRDVTFLQMRSSTWND
ncbi:MotA/TolQ/ExbB proton channel family protein [Chrysiogenes arsenatis]|uniref:MotA/TolQ/ExbB proton channel family protein n=1 Tax=Chrysiogenes arsenatis TaxID=309797 RepID=UPI0003F59C9C|nr:MotA/TolQ/ExbB proton channel family protein [Chrysiogenes arsenatis]